MRFIGSEWSEWGGCSADCGIGFCERRRKYVVEQRDLDFRCERDAPLPGAVLPTEDELGLSEIDKELGSMQDDATTPSNNKGEPKTFVFKNFF